MPKTNPGVAPTSNINENKNDSVRKQSKIPRLKSLSMGPSKLDEPIDQLVLKTVAAPKSNKTIVPTTKNENMGSKNVQTASKPPKKAKVLAGKNVTDIQKKVDPKLNLHGDSSQKPMVVRATSMLKSNRSEDKPTSNLLRIRSKTSLELPKAKICNATTTKSLKVQAKNSQKKQMRTNSPGGDEIQLVVSEKSKLQSFEYAKDKLCEMKSNFMEECENLKDITAPKIKESYRFISLVKNDSCQLMVNNEDLERLPKNLPRESVKMFKDSVEDTLKSGLDLLDNHFADNQISANEKKWRTDRELIRDKLKQHQDRKFEELKTCIDEMCKHPPANGDEVDLKRALNELEESNRRFEEFKMEKEKEKKALMDQHKVELANEIKKLEDAVVEVQRLSTLQSTVPATFCETDSDSNNKRINELLQQIEDLNNCIKDLENCMQKTIADQTTERNNNNNQFRKEIEELENFIKVLENDKQKSLDNTIFLEDQITQLKKELGKFKTDMDHLQTELKIEKSKQPPNVSLSEIQEIYSYKQKYEAIQDDLIALKNQHNLLKDLFAIRDKTINTLETRETEWNTQMDALKFQNFEKESEIIEIRKQMNNKSDDFNRLMHNLVQKEKEMHKLQHIIKLYEERIERSLKLQDQLKQRNATQKTQILELEMKEKLRILFEPLKSPKKPHD